MIWINKEDEPMADESGTMMMYDGEVSTIQTCLARPRREGPRLAVIVLHEKLGLTDHIKRVVDRL
jgi:dienelactone hydrolase